MLIFSLIVFVHEFGHYIVARCFGIDIETFSLGMGREVLGRTDRHGTRWKIAIVPFGGYVKMRGGLLRRRGQTSGKSNLFVDAPLPVRMAVAAAGPAINIALGILLFSLIAAIYGQRHIPATIDAVVPGMPAEAAGIRAGDRVLAIDGHPIDTFDQISEFVLLHPNAPLAFTLRNADSDRTVTVVPQMLTVPDEVNGGTAQDVRIGTRHFGPAEPERLKPLEALAAGVRHSVWVMQREIIAPFQTIAGRRPPERIAGVVGAMQISHNNAAKGLGNFLGFAAFMSFNLALINLLPIPMLDGGFLLFYAIEAVTGKPPADAVLVYSFRFGLALVLSIAVFALWNDLFPPGLAHSQFL